MEAARDRTADADPARANVELVERFFEAARDLDLEATMAFFADDAVYRNLPLPPARGAREIRRQMTWILGVLDRFEVDMVRIAGTEDTVLTERVDVLARGAFEVALPVCGAFDIRDGKITSWRDHFDWMTLTGATVAGLVRTPFRRRS